jgi:O-antigen/teichoic acid export membrane protein
MSVVTSNRTLFPNLEKGNLLFFNFSWVLTGRIAYCACQWGILIALARLCGATAVGQWGLALAVTTPVFTFFDFKLRWLIATDANKKYEIADYVGFRILTVAAAFLLVTLICSVSGLSGSTSLIIVVFALAKSAESLSEIMYGVMQKFERLDYIGLSFVIRGISTLLAVVLILTLTHSVLLAAISMCTVWVSVLYFHDRSSVCHILKHPKDLSFRFNRQSLILLVQDAATLGIVGLMVTLGRAVPRYFLALYDGEVAVGYFTAIAYLHLIGDVVVTSLSHSVISSLATNFKEDISQFRRCLTRLVLCGGVIGITGIVGVYFFGSLLLERTYGPEYGQCDTLLVWLMVGSAAAYMNAFIGAALVAIQKPILWATSSVTGAAACFVTSWIFIPTFGLTGAAWAVVAGSWISLLIGSACVIQFAYRQSVVVRSSQRHAQ